MRGSIKEKILAGVRGVWLSVRSSLAALLNSDLISSSGTTRTASRPRDRSVGHYEEKARSLFEEIGRRKGEESLGDKKLRRKVLSNLREVIRELNGTEATTPRDQVLKKRLLRSLRNAIWKLEAEDVTET
jgi:hypothetical protein